VNAYGYYLMSFALAHQSKDNKVIGNNPSTPKISSSHSAFNKDSSESIIHLQRTIGNQAVQRLIHRGTGFDLERIGIQPKLKVSQPGDVYEQEADRVAEYVMRMSVPPDSIAPRTTAKEEEIDRKCSACEIKKEEDEKMTISRKPSTASSQETTNDEVTNEISNIRSGPSSALDSSVKEFMESRFGYDFSNVRIHTGEAAAKSASSINASAYSVGNDLVFGPGQYAPETGQGRTLLAHELTHMVQQGVATRITSGLQGKTSAPEAGPRDSDTIQTHPVGQAANSAVFKQRPCLTLWPLSIPPMIQRDFALPQPHPEAVPAVLDDDEMQAAIAFNNKVVMSAGAGVVRKLRDVLGVSPDPAVVDEDFVNAVVSWQADEGLVQDGKLGPISAAPLFREIGAEQAGECHVKRGPTYEPSGTIDIIAIDSRKAANFALRADFDSDPVNGIFPSCCEARQFVLWDATAAASFPTGVPNAGFPVGTPANRFIEDRDPTDASRFGHRSGPKSVPDPTDQYLDSTPPFRRNQAFGEIYRGKDQPGGFDHGVFRFMIKVVDVCNGGRTIGTQDFIRIDWDEI
jgi:hypothetical protein